MITNIGIAGAAGRMGRQLIAAVAGREDARLAAALVRPGTAAVASDAGELAGLSVLGVALTDDCTTALAASDVVIDFSIPGAGATLAESCAEAGVPLLTGITGFSTAEQARLDEAAKRIPLLWAPNTSLGMNLIYRLVAMAAQVLGASSDIEILESHHRYKRDIPSGTALHLAEIIATAVGKEAQDIVATRRQGARVEGSVGIASVRAGENPGEHRVLFAGEGEQLELCHRVLERTALASGAVRAALWLVGRPPGRYRMSDLLEAGPDQRS